MWWSRKAVKPERNVLRCSFCNKLQHKVRELIAGPGVFICDECVEVCNDMIADARRFPGSGPRGEAPLTRPNAIRCALCRAEMQTADGIAIAGNRGTLCLECVKAVALAHPRTAEDPS